MATSLVSGEAARKKVGVLDIKGKNFRLHPVPLTQVRSFVTTELSLREHRAELDPEDPKIDAKVTNVMEQEVKLMVSNAREKSKEVLVEARSAGSDAGEKESTLKYKLQRPDEVLVRIRVEHHGFSTINNQRFGAKFVGDVANPSDILLFHRKKDPKLASTVKKKGIQPIAPEELERTNMEDLVREQLAVPEGKLKILGEKDLSVALEDYVDKSLSGAIADVAKEMLENTQKTLIRVRKGDEVIEKESQVLDILEREASQADVSMEAASHPTEPSKKKRKAVAETLHTAGEENSLEDDDDDDVEVYQPPSRKRPTAKSSSSRVGVSAPIDDSSDDDIEVARQPAPKANAKSTERPKRGATKRKVAYALDESDGDDDFESDAIVDDDDDDDDDIEMLDMPPPSKRKAAAPRSRVKPKAAPTRTTTTSGTARKKAASKPSRRNEFDDSDDDVQYLGESADLDVDWGSAATKTQRGV